MMRRDPHLSVYQSAIQGIAKNRFAEPAAHGGLKKEIYRRSD